MALLAYALLHRDQELTRDRIAFALWPDLPESDAHVKLRNHLYYLLKTGLPKREGIPWILSDKRYVRWNSAAGAEIDLDEFRRFASRPETYERAIALYRGELVAGLDEEWVLPLRTDLQERCLSMLGTLLSGAEESGDFAKASQHAKRMLEIDPWREDAVRSLMSARQAAGDRADAVRIYKEFSERLKAEMSLEPAPETVRLYETLTAPLEPRQRRRENLPTQITSFVGREREIEALSSTMLEHRLVTLLGPGGIGKSRLALEVTQKLVDRMSDGVWLVELASTQEGLSVASRIGAALEIRERAGQTMLDALSEVLRSQTLLIVLDNCEHLLEGVAAVADRLLRECPHLRILATSREPIRIPGERLEYVEPLPTIIDGNGRTPALDELSATPATRLFLLRAADRSKAFRSAQLNPEGRRALASICERLDGLPLAIELAAAFTDALTLPQLEQALDRRVDLLTAGNRAAPKWQRTMRATLDWSYERLSEREQTVFERLGAFRRGWSLEAAGFVCEDEEIRRRDIPPILAALTEKSLISPVQRGHSRGYNMLETMRLYALERLESRGELERIRRRHIEWCIGAVESAIGDWIRPDHAALPVLKPELDNIRQALEWSFAGENKALGIRLVHSARAVLLAASVSEFVRWTQLALEALGPGSAPEVEGDLLWDFSTMRYGQAGHWAEWVRGCERALEIYRTLPDRRREAVALAKLVENYHLMKADQKATEASDASLRIARETGDPGTLGCALISKAFALPAADIAARREVLLEGIEWLVKSQQGFLCARAYFAIAELEFESGCVDRAIEYSRQSIALLERMGLPHAALTHQANLPMYLNATGRFGEALELACTSLPLQRKYGLGTVLVFGLLHIAMGAAHLGAPEIAARLLAFWSGWVRARGTSVSQTDGREAELLTESLHRQIDATTLALLFEEGEALNEEQAVALAMTLPSRCNVPVERPRGLRLVNA